jgi:hypothetical protein
MIPLERIVKIMGQEGYSLDKRPNALNIVGIRTDNPVSQDKFDDAIAFFGWDKDGKLNGKVAAATTDPSTYFLKNPIANMGTAILKSGQYRDAYSIGLHKGKYEALVQSKPVIVIRDADRDGYTNFGNLTETGLFGINIHRPTSSKTDDSVIGQDSAGCQVFQYINDFSDMMMRAKRASALYGNKFTYTLIDERDTIRSLNTIIAASVVGFAALASAYAAYKMMK